MAVAMPAQSAPARQLVEKHAASALPPGAVYVIPAIFRRVSLYGLLAMLSKVSFISLQVSERWLRLKSPT